ncbi:MAG: rhodanese-like domain-containing protein [Planctomycetota bacterium]|jgi:rhodanese-related sulfurtransferase
MSIHTITSLELKDLLVREPDLQLIDVRMPAEFREVHVVGARNVPFDRLSAEQLSSESAEDGSSTVYFICKVGKRSHKACEKARELGLPNVVNVEGGTDVCIAAGLPVERGKKAVSLERQVRITAGGLVLVGAVLAVAVHPYWAALPALIGAGLAYSGVTDTCGMGMLLSKMPWNRW